MQGVLGNPAGTWHSVLLVLLLLAPLPIPTHAARMLLQPSNSTADLDAPCPQGSFQCVAPPCSIWPCLEGWTARNDFCTCRCNCTSPPGTSLSTNIGPNSSSTTTTLPRPVPGSDDPGLAADEDRARQPQLPEQQLAPNGSCARLYRPCTCSTQCCGGLVCGFPLRQQPLNARLQAVADAAVAAAVAQELSEARLNATTNSTEGSPAPATSTNGSLLTQQPVGNAAALDSQNSTRSNNSSRQGGVGGVNGSTASAVFVFVDTGGPSCRPAELLDLRSGVVNYGC